MLALYTVSASYENSTVDHILLYVAGVLTLPWSPLLVLYALVVIHEGLSIPYVPFFTVATIVNAYVLYKIGNSITLGAQRDDKMGSR